MDFIITLTLSVFILIASGHSKSYNLNQISHIAKAKPGFPWSGRNWEEISKERISRKVNDVSSFNTRKAKNVILFLGDGMGFPTVASTRIYKAQEKKTEPENNYLTFETLPYSGIARTYTVDSTTADSASTGTAYLCGVKNNFRTIGVREQVLIDSCDEFHEANKVPSAGKLALKQGKWVGIVTTSRVTDASPAAVYAHTPNRKWEAEVKVESCKGKVKDIADQLITDEAHRNIRVILGGGSDMFKFNRTDDRDLIQEWKELREKGEGNYSYVNTAKEFENVNPNTTDYLFGLFARGTMSYAPGVEDKDQPSLTQMTQKAIQILSKAPNGYFLFVEGGRIDHAHHENKAKRAIIETLAFDDSVGGALKMINNSDTLVVVTADHSHVMTIGGYGSWDESVLGFAPYNATDDKDYLQIHYANGPSYKVHRMDENNVEIPRKEINKAEVQGIEFQQDAGIWLDKETHGGEDVPIYAGGPWGHLFQSTEEQTYVAHAMMYAACLGEYAEEAHCSSVLIMAPARVVMLVAVVTGGYLLGC